MYVCKAACLPRNSIAIFFAENPPDKTWLMLFFPALLLKNKSYIDIYMQNTHIHKMTKKDINVRFFNEVISLSATL